MLKKRILIISKKIYSSSRVKVSLEDCLQLHDDLNRLVDWSQKWQMGFNEAKCNVIHLGSTNPCCGYSMRNTPLEAIREEKDLGVTTDRDLKFYMHVSKAVNKAS